MDLSNKRIDRILESYRIEHRQPLQRQDRPGETPEEQDRVTLSRLARTLRLALERVREMPDIREGRVKDLRARIQRGEYHPPAAEIARRLLDPNQGDRP